MTGIAFMLAGFFLWYIAFGGTNMTETNKLLKEIKTLLEVIEKRGR